MSKVEKLKLKIEIYKTIYDILVLKNVGLNILSEKITKMEAQLGILEDN